MTLPEAGYFPPLSLIFGSSTTFEDFSGSSEAGDIPLDVFNLPLMLNTDYLLLGSSLLGKGVVSGG